MSDTEELEEKKWHGETLPQWWSPHHTSGLRQARKGAYTLYTPAEQQEDAIILLVHSTLGKHPTHPSHMQQRAGFNKDIFVKAVTKTSSGFNLHYMH